MKILTRHIALVIALTLAAIPLNSLAADDNARAERNYIKAGNALFRENKFDEAATEYQKAMRANPNSEIAKYNWALSILKQEGSLLEEDEKNIKGQAYNTLDQLVENSSNEQLVENSLMTLGNNDFFQKNYAKAIDRYKKILRKNPGNDEARNNLYLAQKMLKEQQQNQCDNKDQDQNKDQNNDQNKDKKKDQNKDQNKDQDKDQNKDQNKDQDKDKGQNNQQPQPSGTQPQQITPERAEQMLKAIEDKENETRRRVEKEQQQAGQRQSLKPW